MFAMNNVYNRNNRTKREEYEEKLKQRNVMINGYLEIHLVDQDRGSPQ